MVKDLYSTHFKFGFDSANQRKKKTQASKDKTQTTEKGKTSQSNIFFGDSKWEKRSFSQSQYHYNKPGASPSRFFPEKKNKHELELGRRNSPHKPTFRELASFDQDKPPVLVKRNENLSSFSLGNDKVVKITENRGEYSSADPRKAQKHYVDIRDMKNNHYYIGSERNTYDTTSKSFEVSNFSFEQHNEIKEKLSKTNFVFDSSKNNYNSVAMSAYRSSTPVVPTKPVLSHEENLSTHFKFFDTKSSSIEPKHRRPNLNSTDSAEYLQNTYRNKASNLPFGSTFEKLKSIYSSAHSLVSPQRLSQVKYTESSVFIGKDKEFKNSHYREAFNSFKPPNKERFSLHPNKVVNLELSHDQKPNYQTSTGSSFTRQAGFSGKSKYELTASSVSLGFNNTTPSTTTFSEFQPKKAEVFSQTKASPISSKATPSHFMTTNQSYFKWVTSSPE